MIKKHPAARTRFQKRVAGCGMERKTRNFAQVVNSHHLGVAVRSELYLAVMRKR